MSNMNKRLEDIQIKDPSGIKNLMAHAKVVDNNLIIELDFDGGRFALSTYLQLKGNKKFGGKDFLHALNMLDNGVNNL